MRTVVLVLLVFTLLLAGCQAAPAAAPVSDAAPEASSPVGEKVAVGSGSYTDIDPGGLFTMLGDKDFVFVNVHIPFEGDLPNTDVSIPFDEITAAPRPAPRQRRQNCALLPQRPDERDRRQRAGGAGLHRRVELERRLHRLGSRRSADGSIGAGWLTGRITARAWQVCRCRSWTRDKVQQPQHRWSKQDGHQDQDRPDLVG